MKTPLFLSIGVTRADLKHCEKMTDAKEELNTSVREGIIESRQSIKIYFSCHHPRQRSDYYSLIKEICPGVG